MMILESAEDVLKYKGEYKNCPELLHTDKECLKYYTYFLF